MNAQRLLHCLLLSLTLGVAYAGDGIFTRPEFKSSVAARNVTGAMTGRWEGRWGVSEGTLDAILKEGFDGVWGFNTRWAVDHNVTTRTMERLLKSNEPGVVEVKLESAKNESKLLKGEMTLRAATFQRKYIARGVLSDNGGGVLLYAVPSGLQHLVANEFARTDQISASFLRSSYSVEKYLRNTSLFVGRRRPANTFYPTPPESAVQRHSTLRERLWKATTYELDRDSCIWVGELRVARNQPFRGPASYGLYGNLTSFTCNATVAVDASYVEYVSEADTATVYLFCGLLVTILHTVGMYEQVHYARTQSTLSRLSWVTFLNIGILEWSLAGVHWSMMDKMPALLRPVLGLCSFHGIVFHLCARHSYNALEASTSFGRSRMKIWILPILSFPVNLLWWATENRIPVLWVPCLFLLHNIWIPQIYQTANCKAAKPIHPLLLATTLLSRFYYIGNELLRPSLFSPYNPEPWLFVALGAWLAAQTAVVLLQRWLGPTFFVPEKWLTEAYNYHRELPTHFLRQAAALQDSTRKRGHTEETEAFDCVICQSVIDVSKPTNYMLPPCEHLFHPECLIEWMQHKMECPVCRRALPEN